MSSYVMLHPPVRIKFFFLLSLPVLQYSYISSITWYWLAVHSLFDLKGVLYMLLNCVFSLYISRTCSLNIRTFPIVAQFVSTQYKYIMLWQTVKNTIFSVMWWWSKMYATFVKNTSGQLLRAAMDSTYLSHYACQRIIVVYQQVCQTWTSAGAKFSLCKPWRHMRDWSL
jgi:hypothetical protein